MTTALDASFDAAVKQIVAESNLMYGFDQSSFHVQVNEELDTGTIFGGADAEYSFNALVNNTTACLGPLANAKAVFVRLAAEFLQKFSYSFDVARWIAIANAMIVGRDAYDRKYGHMPVDTSGFVRHYMHDPEAALGIQY